MKKTAAVITSVVMLLCLFTTTAFAGESKITSKQVREDAKAAGAYVMQALLTQSATPLYASGEIVTAVGKSGVECSELKAAYTASFKGHLEENGGKLPANTENSGYYAWAINALEALGLNPSNWEGYDLFALFEESAAACGSLYNNTAALTVIVNHKEKLKDSATVEKVFLDGVAAVYQTTEDGATGWDNWGISVDNNGNVIAALAPFYHTDETIKSQIDAALVWVETMKSDDGYASDLKYGTSANANSTGVMLRAFAAMGDSEKALETYSLLQQFRSPEIEGAYTYYGSENLAATKDALVGLNSYAALLEKQEDETETTEPEETTQQATEPVSKEETTAFVTETTTVPSNSGKATPPTGDASQSLMWLPVSFMGISAVGALCFRKRKASEV